jgi:hypothetical protein
VNQIYQIQIIYAQATRVPILFLIILSLNFSQSHTQQELNHTSAINSPNSLSSSNAIAKVFRNLKIPQVPAFDLTDPAVNLSVIPNDQTPAPTTVHPETRFFSTPANQDVPFVDSLSAVMGSNCILPGEALIVTTPATTTPSSV